MGIRPHVPLLLSLSRIVIQRIAVLSTTIDTPQSEQEPRLESFFIIVETALPHGTAVISHCAVNSESGGCCDIQS
jgi:hypothetical protein